MESLGVYTLANLLDNADLFMLIFIRVFAFVMIMPVLGGTTVPSMAKVGLALIFASILYSSGNIDKIYYYDGILSYGVLILKEFFVGWLMGFVVYLIFNITYLTGHLIDQQIGLSMASVYDPITQIQTPISGNLYYFALCVFFIIMNGHHMLIKTFFSSYKAIPIGAAVILENGKLLTVFMELMLKFFVLGTLFAMPIVGIIYVLDLALGIIVKTVPKINVFIVGMPAKVFVGLIAVFIVIPMFGTIYSILYNEISKALLNIIKVMMQ